MRRIVLTLCLLALVGCGRESRDGEAVSADGAEGAGASPERAIVAFDPSPSEREASFRILYAQIHARPAELRDAALEHLRSADPDVRYASLFALSMTAEPGPSLNALQRFLQSTDPSERTMAAAALVANADKAGLPVLIDGLTSTDPLRYYDPSLRVWQLARSTLIQYTDEDMGLLARSGARWQPEAAQARWREWWQTNEPQMSWTGQYFTVRK